MPTFTLHATNAPLGQRDFQLEDHGSIWLFRPLTIEAQAQVNAILQDQDNAQTWGGALVVEPRYVAALALQLADLGYNV